MLHCKWCATLKLFVCVPSFHWHLKPVSQQLPCSWGRASHDTHCTLCPHPLCVWEREILKTEENLNIVELTIKNNHNRLNNQITQLPQNNYQIHSKALNPGKLVALTTSRHKCLNIAIRSCSRPYLNCSTLLQNLAALNLELGAYISNIKEWRKIWPQ